MEIDAGSDAWYFDERIDQDVWSYGVEAWCNLEGQYLSIVSDLSDVFAQY